MYDSKDAVRDTLNWSLSTYKRKQPRGRVLNWQGEGHNTIEKGVIEERERVSHKRRSFRKGKERREIDG